MNVSNCPVFDNFIWYQSHWIIIPRSCLILLDEKEKSVEKKPINPSSPYFLSASDSPGATLVPSNLTVDNYPIWAKAAKPALRAKDKLGFIDGCFKNPGPTSSEFNSWDMFEWRQEEWRKAVLGQSLENGPLVSNVLTGRHGNMGSKDKPGGKSWEFYFDSGTLRRAISRAAELCQQAPRAF
ncbi:hypothetical protein CRG98_008894 [Punica granatum]|uniref:Retrotransposon Copia-like N-terminal domain-containing protein n=1 Tax=Punica granatum TaxID=22663 RepID=A0A2I0KQC7_PUNGR|nr:hypothetical protein CRG98_008894 [Punica granatum]